MGVTLQELLQLKIQHPLPLLGDKGKVECGGVEGYMHTRSDLGSSTNLRTALWVGKHGCHKRLQDLPFSHFLFGGGLES